MNYKYLWIKIKYTLYLQISTLKKCRYFYWVTVVFSLIDIILILPIQAKTLNRKNDLSILVPNLHLDKQNKPN